MEGGYIRVLHETYLKLAITFQDMSSMSLFFILHRLIPINWLHDQYKCSFSHIKNRRTTKIYKCLKYLFQNSKSCRRKRALDKIGIHVEMQTWANDGKTTNIIKKTTGQLFASGRRQTAGTVPFRAETTCFYWNLYCLALHRKFFMYCKYDLLYKSYHKQLKQ